MDWWVLSVIIVASWIKFYFTILAFDPEYARALPELENASPPLSSPQLICEAGLWQTCCPNKYWIPKTEELNDLSDSECKSLITIGTVYEPIFNAKDDFYIFQIWPIRGAMLISVVMPFIAIISGKIAENIGNSETFIKLFVAIDSVAMFQW